MKLCSFKYMISVSFFHVFIVNNWGKCPWGGVFARFYRPGGRWGFELFLPGGGNSTVKKLPRGDGQAWNWLIHKDFYLLTLLLRGGGVLAHTVWLLPAILKPVKLGFQNILFVLSLGNSKAEF